MLLEVDSAYWKLSKEDRKLLFFRHAESLDFKEIANYLSLGTEDAARMRHKRAIKRLVNKLGGYKPYYDEDLEPTEQEDNTSQEQQETDSTD
jgi:DNA-directed RNA polymerase specialized sigma24 family protein